jgi:hypothetical protein
MWKLTCVIAVGVLAGSACHNNPNYCEGAPDNNCQERPDAAVSCGGDEECAAPTPVCDLAGSRVCVECTPEQSGQCTGDRPVCGADHVCRGCAAHAECPSAVCVPEGACAVEAQVAYVDPGGTDNTACTAAAPCTSIAKALATGRPYLKLHGATDEAVVIDNRSVTILGDPDAILSRTTPGIVLEIRGASRVEIHDLVISGGTGTGGIGISIPAGGAPFVTLVRATVRNNAGGGVVAAAGTLVARRSMFLANGGGGISLTNTEFDLENNVIARNGGLFTEFGGVVVSQISTGSRRLEFNTITQNDGMTGATTGVVCSLIGQPITFSSNIIYANRALGGGAQVGGSNCAWTYSDIGPGSLGGLGNLDIDPRFVAPMLDDYHLGAGSPVIDRADPAATLSIDLDGEARPQGAGRDIGADERAP